MVKYVVMPESDLPDGAQQVVTVKGREIAVFNVGGKFYALLNRCPHEGASLAAGARVGLLESDRPGDYRYTQIGCFVKCPWHGWEYDIATGQSYCDPKDTKVKRFNVEVEDGATLAKGPYVAESFPVRVEDRVIVIDM